MGIDHCKCLASLHKDFNRLRVIDANWRCAYNAIASRRRTTCGCQTRIAIAVGLASGYYGASLMASGHEPISYTAAMNKINRSVDDNGGYSLEWLVFFHKD